MRGFSYRVAPQGAQSRMVWWRGWVQVVLASFRVRLLVARRYPGAVVIDVVLPLLIAAFPIAIGRSMPGATARAAFAHTTGTMDYVAYLLIGSSVLSLTNNVLINFAFWMRQEQQTGTLEALYVSVAPRSGILLGTALYGMVYSFVVFVLALAAGGLFFGVMPLRGDLVLAGGFLAVGMVALYGFCLVYGTLVVQYKEVNALIQLALWVINLLAGVYFPVTSLPAPLRFVALLLPPTWINNGVRAALLGSHWVFQVWYLDLGCLLLLAVVYPIGGMVVFRSVERHLQRQGGLGGI